MNLQKVLKILFLYSKLILEDKKKLIHCSED